MLTMDEAIAKLQEHIERSWPYRAAKLACWALAFCYAYGRQWGTISSARGDVLSVQQLQTVTDPRRYDVRFHLNFIREALRWMRSAMNPQRLDCHLQAADGTPESVSIKYAGDKFMAKHLEDIDALRVYRSVNEMRLVLGTAYLKRTIQAVRNMPGPGSQGQIRDFVIGWAPVFPHEVIRDLSAQSTRPGRDEEFMAHEKPRTLAWVKRVWGKEFKTTTTMGALASKQRQLRSIGGFAQDDFQAQSQQPGIMYYEAYFADADQGPGWPWLLPAVVDYDQGNTPIPLTKELVPNPHDPRIDGERLALRSGRLAEIGLPLHQFDCEPELQSPFSAGLPHLLMAGQDIFNHALTIAMRVMAASIGKWLIQKDSIEQPKRMLNSRIDQWIEWSPKNGPASQEPKWVAGPQPPATSMEFLNRMPDWMDRIVMRSPVQMGQTSKRGESGDAIGRKLEAAGMPLEDRRREDELALQEALYGTWLDIANPDMLRLDTARDRLGGEVPDEYIRAMLRVHPAKSVRAVLLMPGTLRPKSPEETQTEFVALGTAGIMDSAQVQRELCERGIPINTDWAKNIEKQTMELARIVGGDGEVSPATEDNHDAHLWTIKLLVGSVQWLALPGEAQEAILLHAALHRQAQIALASVEGMMQPARPGQPQMPPSPPGEAVEAAVQARPGAVPPATP